MLNSDDFNSVSVLIADSQYYLDMGRWDEFMQLFATEEADIVPEADFGFVRWRGTHDIKAGLEKAMAKFVGAAHCVSNLSIVGTGDRAVARYYVQAWQWLPNADRGSDRAADFMAMGVMIDECVRQAGQWRLRKRSLQRLGPGVAVGSLPDFLNGLGK